MMQVGNGKSDGAGFFENRVSISLVHKTKTERRELRKKLEGELNLVRNMVKKLEQCGSGLRSFGDNGVNNGVGKLKRVHSEVGSVGWHEGRPTEKVENDKKNPKMNQFHPSSEQNKRAKGMGKKNGESGSRIGMSNSSSKVFKSCTLLLDRLMKHKHGWVFNVPVDVKALGLHDYFTIIKHPMDLGTVKSRLNTNWYKSPKEFAEDVRLTFHNAMTYNPKGHDVHIMAEILSKMFEEKWSSIEAEYERDMKAYVNHEDSLLNPSSRQVPPSPSPSLPAYPTDMTKTLDNSKTMTNSVAANPKNISSTPPGRTPVPKKPKAKDLHKRAMTYVEKKKLSYELQNLPPEKLGNIVEIIKKRNPALCQNDDEIEIDIDSVDIETLWELDRFVMNCKKNLNKTKRTADLTQAREGTNPTVEENETPSMLEEPREKRAEEKNDPSLLPAQREKKFVNASRSNSSKSSSSDSGASSNGSDTDTLST